jgi:hypothetical protein
MYLTICPFKRNERECIFYQRQRERERERECDTVTRWELAFIPSIKIEEFLKKKLR